MKKLLSRIWVPVLLVSLAAFQSFGIDACRSAGLFRPADSLVFGITHDSSSVSPADSFSGIPNDSLALPEPSAYDDTTGLIGIVLSARDTISVPDSLRETDPFKFKYYVALKDSLTRFHVRDSLMQAGDSLELHRLDSLYIKDSTDVAKAKFAAWYASLSKRERKKYDYEQALPGKIAEINRKMAAKDSIKARKESVIAH